MQLEVFYPHWGHLNPNEAPRRLVHTYEVHENKIAPELLMVADSLVVIEKIAAAVQDRFVLVHLHWPCMM